MRIFSFIEDKKNLVPVEVEVALWPGLPVIQFLGRADSHLKESSLRIKSAIKAAGFDFPVAQQIVVNLRPTHLRKSSRGIELAVAAAYLWMTGQVARPPEDEALFVYGELSLFGEVSSPEDLRYLKDNSAITVLTGRTVNPEEKMPFRRWLISNLKTLATPERHEADDSKNKPERPPVPELRFSALEARLLEILAVGGHHVLLAGPAGSGKSTIAKAVSYLLSEPSPHELAEIRTLNPDHRWRPVIEPHHSTPRMAMIGGGGTPLPGEIARAHQGVLLLDEFLEFDRLVLESLREPFEQGSLRVGRLGAVEMFSTRVQIVATTNLCPCGKYVPGESKIQPRCRFPLPRCRSYAQRLSGPLLDRFHIVAFSKHSNERDTPLSDILQRVEAARAFRRSERPNRELSEIELRQQAKPMAIEIGLSARSASQRRTLATLRVARSVADLKYHLNIEMEDLTEAMTWTTAPFDRLERWE